MISSVGLVRSCPRLMGCTVVSYCVYVIYVVSLYMIVSCFVVLELDICILDHSIFVCSRSETYFPITRKDNGYGEP